MPATPVLTIGNLYGGQSATQNAGGTAATAPKPQPEVAAAQAFTAKNVVLAWLAFVILEIVLRLMFEAAERV